MSGIGLVLNTAKGALSAQQLGLATVSHNIANAGTPSYSRQTLPFAANTPIPFGNLRMGNGVDVQKVTRSCDQILENRVTTQKSTLSSYEEQESNLKIMEALFNEGSDSSTSSLMTNFWNAWHKLSDNPAGSSERIGLVDSAKGLSGVITYLEGELDQMKTKLSRQIDDAVNRVNSIAKEIAPINQEISGLERVSTANDERDKRNSLVTELSELIGNKTFEQDGGSLTVSVANGYTIVNKASTFDLIQMDDGIKWQGSFGSKVDITDKIQDGKIGGWLNLRDEVLPKFKNDIDVMAKELIWQVNNIHSQGIGTDYFSTSLSGVYSTDSSGLLSTLAYGDKIDYSKDFKMWFKDTSMTEPKYSDMQIDMGISDAKTSNWSGVGYPSSTYKFTVVNGGTVDNAADHNDPIIKWEKFTNSDGKKEGEGIITVSNTGTQKIIDSDDPALDLSFDIGSGKLVAGNTFEINTDENGASAQLEVAASGNANSISDNYKFIVTQGGTIGTDEIYLKWTNKASYGTLRLKPDSSIPMFVDADGMKFEFNTGVLVKNSEFTVNTNQEGIPTTNLLKDWHWNLDSFKDQFNRQSFGAKITKTENSLKISPFNDGYLAQNYKFSDDQDGSLTNSFTKVNTKVKILNYKALNKINTDFKISRTAEGIWQIQNNYGYQSAKIIPSPSLDVAVDPLVTNTSASADSYTFTTTTSGKIGTDTVVLGWKRASDGTTGTVTLDPALAPFTNINIDGMSVNFNAGKLKNGDNFTIITDNTGHPSIESVPNDKGFGIDLNGDDIPDMDVDFANPVKNAGWFTLDMKEDTAKYSFAFSDNKFEDSGLTAALGFNTFFEGSNSNSMKINSILTNVNYVAASKIESHENTSIKSDASITLPITVNAANNTIKFQEGQSKVLTATINPTITGGTYSSDNDLQILASNIEKALESASIYGIDYKVNYDSKDKKFIIDQEKGTNIENHFFWNDSPGAALTIGFDSVEKIYTPPDISKDGQIGASDNSNALAITDVQYNTLQLSQWNFERGTDGKSVAITSSLEGFYQTIIGSLGVKSSSIARGRDFNQNMTDKLSEQRDAISAVSLDEEMINMMKFQKGYAAAAKLLTTCDQMLDDLIRSK